MISKIKEGYEDLWKAIIRPPRDEYKESDLGKIMSTPFNLSRTKTIRYGIKTHKKNRSNAKKSPRLKTLLLPFRTSTKTM